MHLFSAPVTHAAGHISLHLAHYWDLSSIATPIEHRNCERRKQHSGKQKLKRAGGAQQQPKPLRLLLKL